jgi:hypothetical protein
MEEKYEVLGKIFDELGISPVYADIFLNKVKNEFENSKLSEITPNFLYTILAFDMGRNAAKSVAEYFEDYQKSGEYMRKVKRIIKDKPWMK